MNKPVTFPDLWSILPSELSKIYSSFCEYEKGEGPKVKMASLADMRAVDNPSLDFIPPSFFMEGTSAVMVISGVITPKSDFFSFLFGGTGLDVLKRDFTAILNDDDVTDIIFDIDSPGGSVFGVQEFANIVFNGRDKKRIIATSRSTMTSAAYWIGAAASEVYIADNQVMTGSIGVITTHTDISELERKIGVKRTEVAAGKSKAITSSSRPLSDEGREDLQQKVDFIYDSFTSDISKFRGVSIATVLEEMAEGRTFVGDDGIQAGLIDGMISLDGLIDVEESGSDEIPGDNTNLFEGGMEMGAKTVITVEELTAEKLKEANPAIYNSILSDGISQGREAGVAEAKTVFDASNESSFEAGESKGAEAERQRILDVESKLIPGHEALIKTLIEDGKTTGSQAAELVLAAEQKLNKTSLGKIEDEAVKPLAENIAAPVTRTDDDGGTDYKAEWDAEPSLKGEFESFAEYEAYRLNMQAGNIKMLKTERQLA